MKFPLRIACLPALLLMSAPMPAMAPRAPQAPAGIACRVLEVHTSERERVTLVLFHQSEKSDGPRLGALLRTHDGEPVEFEAGDGRAHPATLFRLGSCFGRGLLVFPAGSVQVSKNEQFRLKLGQ